MTDVHTMLAPDVQRQVIAHFSDAETFENAVETLENKGSHRNCINMIASHDAVLEKLGHRFESKVSTGDTIAFPQPIYMDRHEVEGDEKLALRLPTYIGGAGAGLAVVATGGTLALAVAVAAAAAVAGAGIGTLLGNNIGKNRAEFLAKQLAMGDLLVTVDVEHKQDETKALELLARSGGGNVHAQSIARCWDDDDAASGNFDLDAYREWGHPCH